MNITTVWSDHLVAAITQVLTDQATHHAELANEAAIQQRRTAACAKHYEALDARHAADLAEAAAKLAAEVKLLRRTRNAYANALQEWINGLRPVMLANGAWMLPSRNANAPHILTKDGEWGCTCDAGASMHWAKALVEGVEIACDQQVTIPDVLAEAADTDAEYLDYVNSLITDAVESQW